MLVGRDDEQAVIDRVLLAARSSSGSGLVLRGEPGIGKSALLDYAAERADGMLVLRAVGVEAESTFAYAALHQLLLPIMRGIDELPDPQADALRVAFGLAAGEAAQPFLVSAAALTLLSEAAPVLCVIDDAQWCDGPSLDALAFVARRLEAEPVALLLAARDGEGRTVDAAGLTELRLSGLSAAAAAALLADRLGSASVDAIVRSTGGNPLAMIELPVLPGAATDEPIPLAGKLERVFLERTQGYDQEVRTLLVLAAAEGVGRIATIRRAAQVLGVDHVVDAALDSPELLNVMRVDGTSVVFRHPLIRSAVYHGSTDRARRSAHQALAAAFDDEATADRRAWHRAKAAEEPSEPVAAELERTAALAVRRSGYAAAAAALESAAELSPSQEDRARRLVAAAGAAWHGGDTTSALALLDRVDSLRPTPALEVHHLRGEIELRTGSPADALAILLPPARDCVETDPSMALRMLGLARQAAYHSAMESSALPEIDAALARLSTFDTLEDALFARGFRIRPEITADEIASLDGLDDADQLLTAGGMALSIGDHALAQRLRAKGIARARATGAAGTLAQALETVVPELTALGQFGSAESAAEEGRRLAVETGRRNCAAQHLAFLANLAGLRGREEQAVTLAEEALTEAVARRLVKVAGTALRAKGLLALAARRPDEALAAFELLDGTGPVPGSPSMALTAAPDHIEAAVRAGDPDRARRILAPFVDQAATAGFSDLSALAARSRALLSPPDDATREFETALDLHAGTDRPFDHARTALLYGEFLRRERQKTAARTHLRSALDTFTRLGTPTWADRANAELRATGQTARERDYSAIDTLTPQELQITQAVAAGATNREIAAQLFISPRTVDYHLSKVFRKLNVSSRRDLMRVAID